MRRALVLVALLAAGCGGTGAKLPEGADESYQRWRAQAETVCQEFREKVEDLPDPDAEADEGSDRERLQRLGEGARPVADLYVDYARRTRAVPLPRQRADRAREYVAAFERRARNYAEIPRAASAGDRDRTTALIDRDEQLTAQLVVATEQAAIRC
jgi:hypothetical protein